MTVTCGDQCVFRVCVHKLRESRVDEACVRIDVIRTRPSKRRADIYTFPENEPVHYGGHTGCRVAYINDQRGTFPRGESRIAEGRSPPKVSKTVH